MNRFTKPFLSLTARDLMNPDVTAIPERMSLRGAAHRLAQSRISGAPVVDAEGKCVGVLSSTDFVAWTDQGERAARQPAGPAGSFHSAWQIADPEALPEQDVSRVMSSDPVTVAPHTPIAELARTMVAAHIHRVIVVDDQNRPIGVVSSTDILSAVAATAGAQLPQKG